MQHEFMICDVVRKQTAWGIYTVSYFHTEDVPVLNEKCVKRKIFSLTIITFCGNSPIIFKVVFTFVVTYQTI